MLIAVDEILLVAAVVARSVGSLDATSRGAVVAGNGEANHRAVVQRDRLLDETLTEGAAADDGAAVVVLDGTGKDFAGRSRLLVDEHHKGYLLVGATAVAAILLTLRFHFISFLFISGLYIFLKLEIFVGKREEEPSKLFFSLIFIFSFLGCVSLIFFYIKTNLPCEWYIVLSIKKGCFSCLISYSWFLFIVSFTLIILLFGFLKDWKIDNDKNIKALVSSFVIINNLGIIIFSFIFKDLIVLITHFLIYKDVFPILISIFDSLRKDSFALIAGIIGLIIISLILIEIILLPIIFKNKLFK